MKKKRRRMRPRADINVTPFIDILLVLLVIFMTISPNERTGLNAAIPQPPPPAAAAGLTLICPGRWTSATVRAIPRNYTSSCFT